MPGDILLVTKVDYGARLPKTLNELPWLNILTNPYTNNENYLTHRRTPGITQIKSGDIIVINQNSNTSRYFLKRCIGLPGDTIRILNKEIIRNGVLTQPPKASKQIYHFKLKHSQSDFTQLLNNLGIQYHEDWYQRKQLWKDILLTAQQKSELESSPIVDSIKAKADTGSNEALIIPQKNQLLELNSSNFRRYEKLINQFERAKINTRNGKFYQGSTEIQTYRFKHSYLYIVGDNRDNSTDSRHWGLLPEAFVIGRAHVVLWSIKNWNVDWKRTLLLLQ